MSQTASSPAQANENAAQPLPVMTLQPKFHGVPWRDPNTATAGPVGFAAPAGAHLTYFGGPIISNVQVIQVLYGSGSYNSQVAGTTSPTMGNFFATSPAPDSSPCCSSTTRTSRAARTRCSATVRSPDCSRLFLQRATTAPPSRTRRSSQNFWPRSTAGHLPAPVLDALGNPEHPLYDLFPAGKNDLTRRQQ